MGVFDVNYGTLVKQLLPVRFRQAIMLAWLNCNIGPIREVFALFSASRKANLYVLAHNGQVCFLEASLNDTFDANLRRIYITDPSFNDPVYTYLIAEDKPVYLDLRSEIGTAVIPDPDPVPLFLNSELYTGSGTAFIINVPALLGIEGTGVEARLKALVNYYKLPAKVYTINYF